MHQLLANRDSDTSDRTGEQSQLGDQMIGGFVDVHRWAKEYLRSRFGLENVDETIPVVRIFFWVMGFYFITHPLPHIARFFQLLSMITNQFYDSHVQLVDAIIRQALQNMQFKHRTALQPEDFAFAFGELVPLVDGASSHLTYP